MVSTYQIQFDGAAAARPEKWPTGAPWFFVDEAGVGWFGREQVQKGDVLLLVALADIYACHRILPEGEAVWLLESVKSNYKLAEAPVTPGAPPALDRSRPELDWIKCIFVDYPITQRTFCGKPFGFLVNLAHAAGCIVNKERLQPCPDCMRLALQSEQEAEAATYSPAGADGPDPSQ